MSGTGAAARLDPLAAEVARIAAEHAGEVDHDERFPVEALAALRETALLGLLVPAEHGGPGGDLADVVRLTQRLSASCLSTGLVFTMHCQQVEALVRFGSPALRATLLPRIAAGEVYLASVTTEDGPGGLLDTGTPLLAGGGGYAVERHAPVVTGGRHADGFVLTMRASPEAGRRETTLCYADRRSLTVHTGPPWRALGMRGVENVGLTLSGHIPAENVIGTPGRFREIAVEVFAPAAHLGWSAAWLGAARGAFGALLRLLRGGGLRADPRSDLVLHQVARIRGRLEAVGGYLHGVLAEVAAARAADRSLDAAATQIHLNTLKVLAAEETYAAANAMVALAGLRSGYLRDSPVPLERLVRDLRSASLNHDDTRLLEATGALCLLDTAVSVLGT